MESYVYSSSYHFYAAPVIECPDDISFYNGTCPGTTSTNGKAKVVFWAVDSEYYYSSYQTVSGPEWSVDTQEASKLKYFYTNYLQSAIDAVTNKYGTQLDYTGDEPLMTWRSLDSTKSMCKQNAVGTLVGALLVPFIGIIILCVVLYCYMQD
jgi:hypothetical protein